MTKIIRTIVPSILLFTLALNYAQVVQSEEMAETPAVVESFSCNFIDGKGSKDLDSAVSYWQSQMGKIDSADLKNYFAAIITPVRSSTDADFLWLGATPNLNSFARGTAAYAASDAGQAADARFAKMSRCKSNLFFSEQVYTGSSPGEGNTDFVLEGYGCTLRKGKTMANVVAAEAYFTAMFAAMKSEANVYRWTPYIANTPADLVYLVAHNDLISFGSHNTSVVMSEAGEAANNALFQVMDCEGGLYAGDVIHTPAAE
jgi:hypothetical protein